MATATVDVWTEEKCLQLIREYRARPILWDQKHPFFFKKTMKPAAWEEIGASIDVSAEQCKHKMTILMSSFRREKAKISHSLRNVSDLSEVYKSTWFAFKDLSFLLDKESERKRNLNDPEETDEDDGNNTSAASLKATLLSYHLDTPPPHPKRAKKSMLSVKKELVERVTNTERSVSVVPTILAHPGPSQTQAEVDEEIKSFTSFIGNKMKRYSDTTKNAVQQAICSIIFKADQNYYESNSYEKFTIIDAEPDPLDKQIMLDDDSIDIKIQRFSDSE